MNRVAARLIFLLFIACAPQVVTLTGAVQSEEQRSAAEAAVRALDGVAGVTNHIVVG